MIIRTLGNAVTCVLAMIMIFRTPQDNARVGIFPITNVTCP
jgi:hypothetical protein